MGPFFTNSPIVYVVATQEHLPQMRINALNIADLSEMQEQAKQQPPPPVYDFSMSAQAPTYNSQTTSPTKSNFVDPAILSMGRRPGSETPLANAPSKASNPPPAASMPPPALPAEDQSKGDLGRLFKGMAISKAAEADSVPVTPEATPQKRKPRNRNSRQSKQMEHDDDGGAAAVPGSHGKGWRQTPILQSTASFQPFKALKKNGKAPKDLPDNGWASEDVTEEMPEFDFENNLAKFDKRTIFDQMRKDDAVDEADRLVSHNRKPKPGTAGGKNLHYTENVLDLPPAARNADYWNSEAEVGGIDEGVEVLSGRDQRNGQPVKRADSKSGPSRRSQSRKASAAMGGQPLSRVNSSVRQSLPSRRSSPRSGYRSAELPHQAHQPGLYLVPSNRRVEAISTLQMLNLENIAANELAFPESLMAENAGRGIAEVAVQALADPALKVRYQMAGAALSQSVEVSPIGSSTIVILAGNNKSSTRALVAGRHLRNKGYDVMVCLVGIERERDLLEELRRQVQIYRSFGGKVLKKNDFFEQLRKTTSGGGAAATAAAAAASRISVSLIIDALLGLTMSFEELRIGDQATVYELMEWANRNEAFVLSVDVPSGIDPGTGKVAIIDGSQLFVKPRYVVAVGAPKRGLVEAVTPPDEDDPELTGGVAQDDEWRMFLVDMGLGHTVWRKAGTKVRKGIDFDGKWVLEMKYRGVESESDDY